MYKAKLDINTTNSKLYINMKNDPDEMPAS